MQTHLNTEQAAAYLGIGERKLYELVATSAVPCSKVTGKWLFPRAALDRWIEAGLSQPQGFNAAAPPPIIGGSHDPLLEWCARQSGSGLALLSVGSEAGLEKLAANDIAIAAVHMHAADDTPDAEANLRAVESFDLLRDTVVLAFARREQGLLLAPGNPQGIHTLQEAAASGAVCARRQAGAGAELLLMRLLREAGLTAADLKAAPSVCATGDDLAFAVKSGAADWGVASRAVAEAKGLAFVPLAWEHFDLVMRRRTYFEPGPQALLACMRMPAFADHAAALGGLDVSAAGAVRLAR
jgi:putative molybdopterin biosynthesis protein